MSNEKRFGATGQFPYGKLGPTDEGELQAGMAIVGDKVVIQFGKPVSWTAMTAEQAINFAILLRKKAEDIIAKRKK